METIQLAYEIGKRRRRRRWFCEQEEAGSSVEVLRVQDALSRDYARRLEDYLARNGVELSPDGEIPYETPALVDLKDSYYPDGSFAIAFIEPNSAEN
jgi:hypothetical protein